jgi:gamma-glutamyltranspeptidase/glutathione hydrolase
VVAVDRLGNVAAIMHSINTVNWGTTGIFVDGVSVPDAGAFLQEGIRAAGPPHPERHASIVVLRNGKPVLGSAAIGGAGTLAVSVQSMTNALDYGMGPRAAVDTTQFLGFEFAPARSPVITVREGDFSAAMLAQLAALGQEVRALPPAQQRLLGGHWVGIAIDPVTGALRGGGSRRLNGMAEGY